MWYAKAKTDSYGVKPEEILKAGKRRSEARDVAIYALKKKAGLSSRIIGERMGVGASAVGNRWLTMKKRIREDKKLAQKISKC